MPSTPSRRTVPAPLWRLLLVIAAVLASQGGRLHPSAEATEPLRAELATMTASDDWVPAHVLLLSWVALLAIALWLALRLPAFAGVRGALRLAAIAVSLYVVEAALHLAAVVDSDALANGESAPVAMTHVVLSAMLYPASGLAIVHLSVALAREWTGVRRLVAVPGVVGGAVHAVTVPATLLLPDAEMSPFFAAAGLTLALWALSLAVLTPGRRPAETSADTPHHVTA